MHYVAQKDGTDFTIFVDAYGADDFLPEDGLAYDTSGLQAYYAREGATPVEITLADQTVTGSHTDGGFKEIDPTNLPGTYRLDLPDAAIATGVNHVRVYLLGTSIIFEPVHLTLVDFDPHSAPATPGDIRDEFVANPIPVDSVADPVVAGSLGAQAKLDVNAEVDTALNTAVPGSPTADSINERVKTLDDNYTSAKAAFLDAAISTRSTPAQVSAVETDTQNIQSRLPAALVGGRMDASVGAVATDAISAAGLSAGAAEKAADALINRNIKGGSNAGRRVYEALSRLRNKWEIVGSTLTVYDVDDSTPLFTADLTTADVDPVTGLDPTT